MLLQIETARDKVLKYEKRMHQLDKWNATIKSMPYNIGDIISKYLNFLCVTSIEYCVYVSTNDVLYYAKLNLNTFAIR